MNEQRDGVRNLTAEIVGAFISHNPIPANELPDLIRIVHRALLGVGEPEPSVTSAAVKLTPAQIKKSVTPDALISFEDGKSYKTLKRHLSKRRMTLADYKTKWGLPMDYPTTAPGYSERRSALAKALGFGRAQTAPKAAPPPSEAKPIDTKSAPRRRRRPSAANRVGS